MKNIADFLLPHLYALCCFYKPKFPNVYPDVYLNMLGERIPLEHSECIGNILVGLFQLPHHPLVDELGVCLHNSVFSLEVRWKDFNDVTNTTVDHCVCASISYDVEQTHNVWWEQYNKILCIRLCSDKQYRIAY